MSSRASRQAMSILAAAAISGCASLAPVPITAGAPRLEPEGPFKSGNPVALVLSGGSARGYAHVGVIGALEAHGLRPDIVVGTSAGSLVGALYASGLAPRELHRAVAELDANAFADLNLPTLGLLPGTLGLLRGDGLHRFIDQRTRHHRIEDFPMRFAAVATDLSTGAVQLFNAGDAGLAVRASSAIPGVFAPAAIGGRLYADGQLASPLPVMAARSLGARIVIAVDVVYPPRDAALNTAIGVLFQAFTIASHRLKTIEARCADIVIAPDLGRTAGQLSFADREHLIAAGRRAAEEAMPAIRKLMSAPPSPPDPACTVSEPPAR